MRNSSLIKLIIVLVLVSAPIVSQACGSITGLFTSEEKSLEYVGGIEFHSPIEIQGKTRIPITFHGGKWQENSAIAFKKVNANVSNNEIHITVVTCIASSGKTPAQEIVLKRLIPGAYEVVYKNPDGTSFRLDDIEIK